LAFKHWNVVFLLQKVSFTCLATVRIDFEGKGSIFATLCQLMQFWRFCAPAALLVNFEALWKEEKAIVQENSFENQKYTSRQVTCEILRAVA